MYGTVCIIAHRHYVRTYVGSIGSSIARPLMHHFILLGRATNCNNKIKKGFDQCIHTYVRTYPVVCTHVSVHHDVSTHSVLPQIRAVPGPHSPPGRGRRLVLEEGPVSTEPFRNKQDLENCHGSLLQGNEQGDNSEQTKAST